MTRLITITTLTLLIGFSTAMADVVDPVLVGSGDSKLTFKADRDMVGGTILLYQADGTLVAWQRVRKRKVVIDFSQASFGEYRVVVAIGDRQQVLYYMKK